MASIEVTIKVNDANGKSTVVNRKASLLAGDTIPSKISTTAKHAADEAWENLSHSTPTHIEYSAETTVRHFLDHYSAFARNSYIARVTFPNDKSIIVILPENARGYKKDEWDDRVTEWATKAMCTGSTTIIIPNSIKPYEA